jgi:hypothetical protein
MTRVLFALFLLSAPLLLSGCIGYSERVVVRDRPGYGYGPPAYHGGYWGPPPRAYYGPGWRRW